MTNEEKLNTLSDVFEDESFTEKTPLTEVSWDSMAKLSVVALAKAAGKTVTMKELQAMQTIQDIMDVL